jgi:PAS domain S-box-containing protein
MSNTYDTPGNNWSGATSEAVRLAALREYQILDTPAEMSFDRMTKLVSRLFDVPVGVVVLMDSERLWFKSIHGLDISEIPRKGSFCAYAIEAREVLIVPDATLDDRFAQNPIVVGEPNVRFYMGAPLINSNGYALGTLCILDTKPRQVTEEQKQTISDLAAIIVEELELRLTTQRLLDEMEARSQAQKALRDSEIRFQSAFEMSATGTAIVALDGTWLKVNKCLCNMLHYSEVELLKLTFQDITYLDDLEGDLELVRQLLAGEINSYILEKRYLRGDGTLIWAILNVALVCDEQGIPNYFVAQIQDISERKQAENDLRHSEARKTAILETALDCIVTIDKTSQILEWNPAAEKTFGYSRQQALGSKLQELIIPQDLRLAHKAGMTQWAATGNGPILGKRHELPALCADGSIITVELAVVAIPDSEPPIFTGHMRDISERKAQENALRESEARFHRIIANVPGMVFQFVMRPDGSYHFPFVGEGSRELFDLAPAIIEDDPATLINYIHPEEAPFFEESVARSATTLEPWLWRGRMMIPGGMKWIRGESRPKREDNGQIIWDGILFDMTQSKLEEEALRIAKIEAEAAREEAERANLAKSEFLSRMSHELRTPLNAILGFGQLLEISQLNDDDVQSVEQIIKAGNHLLALINEVLDIARIESGQLLISPEPVNACEIAIETLDLVRPLATARGIQIHDAAARGCELYMKADRQRLKQILLNLLSNAVKYNRDDGTLILSIQEHGESVRVSVRDTGYGIAPQFIDRIGTPFDRLGAIDSGIEGTGVGLAVSKRLALAMGTELCVWSEVGVGSEFWIDLPYTDNPHSNHESEDEPEDVDTISTRLVVLYIEDNPSNLHLVQRILGRRPEIRMLSAMQGNLGCELARFHCPDLILLDMHLSDMSGYDVLRQLKEHQSTTDIPVIILSADATVGHIRRAIASGAHKYLSKPLVISEFFDSIDEVIELKSKLVVGEESK